MQSLGENIKTTLNVVNKCVTDNNNILSKYLKEISDNTDDEDYKRFQNKLDNIENELSLDKETIPFKQIILNIVKTFMIINKRVDVGDGIVNKLVDNIDDKDLTIESLKKYIVEHQELLKQNNIEIPKYKQLELSIHSNVKTPSALAKRLKLLNITDNSSKSISEWLNNVESGKIDEIPKKKY
jgi:hypothetical protein